jgi:hypothetical protein
MNICDPLRDILKHTNGLGFIEMVKLIGTTKDAKIEAMDNDKSVIMYGQMYQPIEGIDSTVGMSRLNVLKGCIDYQNFGSDKAKVSVVKQTRESVDVPVEIKFDSGNGTKANYRFMAEAMVNEQIKVPPFKGAKWNAVVEPTKAAIADLAYFGNMLGSFESTFIVSSENDALYFSIGQGTNDRTIFKFADGVSGNLKNWAYPLSQVLSILKLSSSSDCTMSFSDMGALKIDIDSGLGKYEYILPARQQ